MAKDTVKRLLELRQQLNEHSRAYHVYNTPVISDEDYDRLFRELQELERLHPELEDEESPTARIGELGVTSFEKVRHKRAMLSLDNAFSAAEVLKFFGAGVALMVEPKIDGLSLDLTYVNGRFVQAVTRGDGRTGEDVTDNVKTITSVPLRLTQEVSISVRGEAYMTYTVFNRLNQQNEISGEELFANPRNAAAGSLRLKKPAEVAKRHLSFVAYMVPGEVHGVSTQYELTDYLEVLGFPTVLTLPVLESTETLACECVIEDVKDAFDMIERGNSLRPALDVPTDGLVLKVMSLKRQADLGEGTRAPKWAVAYKFPPERKVTVLKGITLSVGKTGKITPIGELETVILSGTKVSRASLCNQDEIERLRVDVGDQVLVEKSAEIIPKIVGVIYHGNAYINGELDCSGGPPSSTEKPPPDFRQKASYPMRKDCPSCNHPLVRPAGMVDYFCRNESCPEQVYARLKHATSKHCLDIDGCGEAMIRELMTYGVTDLYSLFTLKEDAIKMKQAARKKFLDGRQKALKAPLWRKLHALNIEGFGRTICQEVASRWSSVPAMMDESDEFAKVVSGDQGRGGVLYRAWADYITSHGDMLDALEQVGFVFEDVDRKSGPLSGKVFVITGDMETGIRDDVIARIEDAGGLVKSSVSRQVNYLVVGHGAGNTKIKRAQELGTTQITEKQLYQLMGQEMPEEIDIPTGPR